MIMNIVRWAVSSSFIFACIVCSSFDILSLIAWENHFALYRKSIRWNTKSMDIWTSNSFASVKYDVNAKLPVGILL